MKPFNLIAGKAQAAIAVALLVGAGLSGCGSSDDDHGNGNGNGGGGGTPAPLIDAFFTAVSSFIAASADTTESAEIDAVVITTPENTEPESLG